MENIDWSKAPEGATHYLPQGGEWPACWIKKYDTGRLDAMLDDGDDDRWGFAGNYRSKKDLLIARPRPSPSWSGQGLPPVGIDCEYIYMRRGGAEWFHCTVIAEHDGGVVVAVHEDDLSYSYWHDTGHFRPIRTAEQIAKDEREAACEEMLAIAKSRRQDPDLYEAIATIYDSGYRKP